VAHIYSDRIFNISITGPIVRIELATVRPPQTQGQQPTFVPAETVVMPLDGFIASFQVMDEMVKKLVAEGVIQVQAPQLAKQGGEKH
jgi:hypothetical protein